MLLGWFAFALGSAVQQAATEPAPVPATAAAQADDPAMAEAVANKPRMKRRPEFAGGPQTPFPESEKALGHHGTVLVSAIIGADGHTNHVSLAKSSGAPGLDAIALSDAAGAIFKPAADADGNPIAVPVKIPYDFYAYQSDGKPGGLSRYSCAQFVRDSDWWRATFPDRPWSDEQVYTMTIGARVMARLANGGLPDASTIKGEAQDFAARWPRAIAACRAAPERRFADVIQPEGKLIDAFSKAR